MGHLSLTGGFLWSCGLLVWKARFHFLSVQLWMQNWTMETDRWSNLFRNAWMSKHINKLLNKMFWALLPWLATRDIEKCSLIPRVTVDRPGYGPILPPSHSLSTPALDSALHCLISSMTSLVKFTICTEHNTNPPKSHNLLPLPSKWQRRRHKHGRMTRQHSSSATECCYQAE